MTDEKKSKMRWKEAERPGHGATVDIPGYGRCIITHFSKKSRIFRFLNVGDGMLHSIAEPELYLKIGPER